jgi:protein-tyrosine kinase
MNLRKALDKAQKEREEEKEDILSIDWEDVLEQEEKKNREWQAPEYSDSSKVKFNREALVKNKCVSITPGAAEFDQYKVLRAQIMQRTREKGWNTLMVTSAKPGEGKTLTSINMAIALAKEFHQTVLLVDCDLKKQDVHKRFGYESEKGLGDYLVNDCSLNEIISWPGVEKLTLISGGQTVENTTELLGSPQMKDLVAEMKKRYADRYVIFDLPSLLEGADAITFAPLVDGIVMVTQAGRNTAKEIKRSMEVIPQEKFLGFVLNRQM